MDGLTDGLDDVDQEDTVLKVTGQWADGSSSRRSIEQLDMGLVILGNILLVRAVGGVKLVVTFLEIVVRPIRIDLLE